jgi:Glycosyl hydrolase family 26
LSKGVHNVVWEVSWASNTPNSTWNPGAGFFDVAGQDYVTSDAPARVLVGNTIPISVQENGPLPNVATMFNAGSQSIFLFWNTWAGFESQTSTAQTIASYTDPHTINLGDVPNLN